jgi:hypothetical protein
MPLPMSSTGKRAWISLQTIRCIHAIRSSGIPFVLLSGARTSTILERLPWLPRPDAVATENGGVPAPESSALGPAPCHGLDSCHCHSSSSACCKHFAACCKATSVLTLPVTGLALTRSTCSARSYVDRGVLAGRIFLADGPWQTACSLREDFEWRAMHEETAGAHCAAVPPTLMRYKQLLGLAGHQLLLIP